LPFPSRKHWFLNTDPRVQFCQVELGPWEAVRSVLLSSAASAMGLSGTKPTQFTYTASTVWPIMCSFVGSSQNADGRDEIAVVGMSSAKTDSIADHPHAPSNRIVPLPSSITMNAIDMPPPSQRRFLCSDEMPAHIRHVLDSEREAKFFNCCRQYPKAMAWSLLLFCTVVMEAYGKSLITGFFAFPAFQRRYGTKLSVDSSEEQRFEISPAWQMGLQNAALICEIIGLLTYGYATYIIGYRKTMIASLLWICGAVFPAVFAPNKGVLLAAQALSGKTSPNCFGLYILNVICRNTLGRYSNTCSNICG
jgi:hypothetical protein